MSCHYGKTARILEFVRSNGLTKSAVLFCPASTALILMKELGPVDTSTEEYLISLNNELVRVCDGKVDQVVDGVLR